MRSLLLAAVAMLAVPACSNDITGGSGGTSVDAGGGGGGGGATCTCPDGTVLQNDDCATDCPAASSPSISLAVSQSSIGGSTPVELGVETDLTVTVTSVMGFTGPVTLSATAVGSDGTTPVTDWTLAFDNANLSIASDGGSATATLGVEAMGDTAALAGTITVTATAGSAAPAAPIAVMFKPQLHIEFANNGNDCTYPAGHGMSSPWMVKVGRSVAVYNMTSNSTPMIVHSDNAGTGFQHEGDGTGAAGTAAGAAYTQNITATGTTGFWCHNQSGFLVDLGDQSVYNYFTAVN